MQVTSIIQTSITAGEWIIMIHKSKNTHANLQKSEVSSAWGNNCQQTITEVL